VKRFLCSRAGLATAIVVCTAPWMSFHGSLTGIACSVGAYWLIWFALISASEEPKR
jgi:hypothetical protein